jgi:hypothetical protein
MFTRSKLTHLFIAIFALSFISLFSATATSAQDDPPGVVGRVSFVRGSVSFQPAGTEDWATAEINRPITIGDKLWADQDSLVEVGLGSAAIRLNSNTAFTILNLDDNVTQVSVSEGTINVHLRRLDDNESFEVDTPNLAFSLLRPGDYRIVAGENGDATVITVRGGDGEVTGGGQAFTVHAGQTASVTGTDELNAELDDAFPNDDFDNWCLERNRRADDVPKYVSPEMVGYDELNSNGAWRDVPEYGAMWVPNGMVADWAPYRYGHWVWISPWGWTWVDDASWGFAPFHYGRWVQYGGAWGWLPGPVVVSVRPVYAPALVAWVGSPGGGVAIGVGVGVAWFPLGPREVFVPPYAVSARYVTQVNVTNTNVTNVYVTNVYQNYTVNKTVTNVTYANRTYVTATSQNAFSTGQPVGRNLGKVDARVIEKAPVGTAVGAGVVPQQRSLFAANAGAAKAPPAKFAERPVVAKLKPPPPQVSFAARQDALKANGGRPLSTQQVNAIRTAAPAKGVAAAPPAAVKIAPPVRAGAAPPKNNLGNRPGQPPQPNGTARPTPTPAPATPPAANAPRPAPAQPNAPVRPAAPAKPADNDANRPGGNSNERPVVPPAKSPVVTPPPNSNQPPPARPAPVRPDTNKPAVPADKPAPPVTRTPPPDNRPPAATRPPADNTPPAKPAPPPARPAPATAPPARPAPPPPAAKPSDKPKPDDKKKDDKKKPKDDKDKDKP